MRPGDRLVLALTALAALLTMMVLIGWSLNIPLLRGLGYGRIAVQPFIAVHFLLLVIAFAPLIYGLNGLSRPLLLLPGAIVVPVLAHHLIGDFGLGRLFFPSEAARVGVANGGVPGYGALSLVVLMIVAIFLVGSPRWSLRRWAVPIASVGLAATLLLAVFTLTHALPTGQRFIGRSSMSALPMLLLAAAIIAHGRTVDPQPFGHSPWRILHQLSPAIIIVTILPSLLLIGLRGMGLPLDGELYYIGAICNLALVAGLLAYVTARAAEQNSRLARRQAELDSILESAPDALVVAGQDQLIRTFSEAAERLWRWPAAAACGHPIQRLFARALPDFEQFLDGAHDPVVARSSQVITIAAKRHDGTEFPAELRLGIAAQDGQVVYAAFVRDLSEQLATDDQLADLSQQLAHLSRQNAMGELAGDIAHEINQPLAAASNYASAALLALPKDPANDQLAELLRQVTAQILRAGSIISRLRQFLSNREVEAHRERLAEVVADAVNLVLVGSRKVTASLEVDIPSALPRVYIDRVQIQQVLVNILRNAFEACDQAGRIPQVTIRAGEVHRQLVAVEVSDNGPGLPEGFVERLGERLSSSKGASGMGIGLNISKRIVEAHGGTLTAGNRDQGGAWFRFTVPTVSVIEQDLRAAG